MAQESIIAMLPNVGSGQKAYEIVLFKRDSDDGSIT